MIKGADTQGRIHLMAMCGYISHTWILKKIRNFLFSDRIFSL